MPPNWNPETGASGLNFVPSAIRRPAYFDGLLKVLQVLNIDYDMANLNQSSGQSLKDYKQVWAFCTDEMNAKDQQTLVDYAFNGGHLVIFPNLPDREMSQKLCTILRDAISISPVGTESIDSPLVDLYDLKDIKCANPQMIYAENSLIGDEIIARTIRGSVCGFEKKFGGGALIHLGTWLGFDTEGHKPAYLELLNRSGARLRRSHSGNENMTVRQRFTEEGRAMLFIGNYFNEDHVGKIMYSHPVTGEEVTIPYAGTPTCWPALYAVLTPVGIDIAPGLKMLHCTSDILDISVKSVHIELILYGDRDLLGEIVLEGEKVGKIKSVEVDGEALSFMKNEKRMVVNYIHKHRIEVDLKINIGE